MRIDPFAVEQWMDAHEARAQHNCGETCVDSVTIEELLEMTGCGPELLMSTLLPLKLTYGHIPGSPALRQAVAALYPGRGPDDVLITHGAIGANELLYKALVGPGDEVIAIVPNYQQHYSIPEALGANVIKLWLKPEDGYQPDLQQLASLVTPHTRIISYSNPNNPTGAVMDEAKQRAILRIASSAGAYVIADEVYRGIDQGSDALGPSAASLDAARGIGVGSMSKAFGMAGVRLGWVVAPPEVLQKVMLHRDYNTISVGVVDDALAALALSAPCLPRLLARNRAIARANLARVAAWVAEREGRVSWVPPAGGTVTLLHYKLPSGGGRSSSSGGGGAAGLTSEQLCLRLMRESGVLLVPGSAFGLEGCVRVGFGNAAAAVDGGLAALGALLDELWAGEAS